VYGPIRTDWRFVMTPLAFGKKPSLVVARFKDGHLLKGSTLDFFPNRDAFHIQPTDMASGAQPTPVKLSELKAVFFVKSLAGDPNRKDAPPLSRKPGPSERPALVVFKDGEVITGGTLGYSPGRSGFFVTPLDLASNNERIYIVQDAVKTVRLLGPNESAANVLKQMDL
ncbi:MAG: hypothetical protein V2A58_06655, partial [Planctomycetota bacterium]